ncbi:enoyl-CoA hydratase family protein [soil metagenome]
MSTPILVEQKSVFTLITLNRPERRNALTIELMNELVAAVTRANADASRRAIILRGAGEGFCAGLDLKQAQETDRHEESARSVANMLKTVHTSKLVTIAAVHGHAMAGGAGLVAACDLAVASAGTKFGYPEVRRGLVPALVSTLLRHQVGDRRLRELFLAAEPITAERALEFGLINRVVAAGADAALNGALELANSVAQGAPGALANTKQLLADLRSSSIEHDLQKALEFHEHARTGDEAAEGIAAFMQKRSPKWAIK